MWIHPDFLSIGREEILRILIKIQKKILFQVIALENITYQMLKEVNCINRKLPKNNLIVAL